MLRSLAIVLFLVQSVVLAVAQDKNDELYPHFDLFVGYSANGYFVNESPVTSVNQNVASFFTDRAGGPRGFELSLGRNFDRYVGLKGDFSAYFETLSGHAGTVCQLSICTAGQPFQVSLRTLYYMAGPEFRLNNRTLATPFVHTLIGVVHSSAMFSLTGTTTSFSDSSSQNGFAGAFGGGFDLRINRWAGLRTTLDYVPTFLSEATRGESGPQNHFRISIGGVFHF